MPALSPPGLKSSIEYLAMSVGIGRTLYGPPSLLVLLDHALFLSAVFFDKGRKSVRVVGMPTRQRRAVLDNVAGGPQYASLVEPVRHVGGGAQDIEIPRLPPRHHEIHRLLRSPGGSRFGAALGGQCGEY